jgi:hypothetical protein
LLPGAAGQLHPGCAHFSIFFSAIKTPLAPFTIAEKHTPRHPQNQSHRLSARNLPMLGVRVSFAWKEPACSFPCGREFSGQYVGVVPAIELIGEIQFHAR